MVVLLALGLGQGAAQAEPRELTLDAQASRIVIHVGKSGMLRFAGHEHDVLVDSLRGKAVVDPERIERSSVDVTIDAASLRATRKGAPAKDLAEVQANMMGPKCLDAARFPGIRFVSKAVSGGRAAVGARDLTIRGDLTLHGVTREITLPVRLQIGPDSLEATGTMTIRQRDFGITPVSIAGLVSVKNELPVTWRFVARRAISPGR